MHHSWIRRGVPGLLLAVIISGCSGPFQPVTTSTANPSEEIRAFHGLGKLADVRDGRLDILNGETDTLQEVEGAAPAGAPALSPDGSRIAYVKTLPYQDPELRSDVLEVVPVTDGPPTRWYLAQQAGIDLAGWWPDGQGILFWVRPMHCNSCIADGLPLQSLALGSAEPKQLPDMLLNRRWLSWGGGRDLLIVRGGGRPVWDNKSLAVCDVGSATCRDLPQDAVSLDPAWSPDGSQIAFVKADRRPGEWGFATEGQLGDWIGSRSLWLIAPDGSSPREIQAAGRRIYGPAWAKDSRHLLYVKDGAVWLLAMDQPKPQRLVTLGEPQDRFGFYG